MVIAYRHASYITPLWAVPNPMSGRFHRAGQIAQYLCLHPLGPAAEFLRNSVGFGEPESAGEMVLDLWAIQVPDEGIIVITFNNCAEYEITPEELVGDSHAPTQNLADRILARGLAGIRVPSAALPGTENLVLFGSRVADDYLAESVQLEELPTGHLTDYAHPPAELYPWVRLIGLPHATLNEWQSTGVYESFHDPIPDR